VSHTIVTLPQPPTNQSQLETIMNSQRITNTLLGGAFAGALAGTASANLIVNGDFEQPVYPSGSNPHNLAPGNSSLIGWTIGGNGGVTVNHTGSGLPYWNPPLNSSQWLDLTGASGGAYIEQSFATILGRTYYVSLDAFNGSLIYSAGGPVAHGFDISATGNAPLAVSITPGTAASVSYSFTATGSSTTLRFTEATGRDSNAGWIDNVVVTVPDGGATAVLLGISLGGLACFRRKLT
jgi:hypothetical protein